MHIRTYMYMYMYSTCIVHVLYVPKKTCSKSRVHVHVIRTSQLPRFWRDSLFLCASRLLADSIANGTYVHAYGEYCIIYRERRCEYTESHAFSAEITFFWRLVSQFFHCIS